MASTVQSSGSQAYGKNSSQTRWEDLKDTNLRRGSSPTSASKKFKNAYHWLENRPRNPICFILALSALLGCLFWPTSDLLSIASYRQIEERQLLAPEELVKSSLSTEKAPLNVFQVYMPVTAPYAANEGLDITDGSLQTSFNSCQVVLMNHSFGNSYGSPFVGDYTPPSCKFNRVIMNFTATSRGRQFDRLAVMYFNDTEIWRTSTAEPTTNGIIFEYTKDMTAYLSLWSKHQKIIFDLGNVINDVYTGPFNTTLIATFFTTSENVVPATQIIPISARKGSINSPSAFVLPSDTAVNSISLPKNTNRAVVSIGACGQAMEEFWWGNVLQSDIHTFDIDDMTLNGFSPFREVQLLIDGKLAGVYWPFPVIFTGGVVPGLWRPIVGIDTYDLREHQIDITPWLGVILDGNSHTFEIRVAGIQQYQNDVTGKLTESVGDNWVVTGKVFIWLDSDSAAITTGTQPEINLPDPLIYISHSISQNSTGANETITYTANVQRSLSITSTIETTGGSYQANWSQNLSTSNYGHYEAQGAIQITNQTTSGVDESRGAFSYKTIYSYPLWTNTTSKVLSDGNYSLDAVVNRGLSIYTEGSTLYPTGIEAFFHNSSEKSLSDSLSSTQLDTTQKGAARYFSKNSTSSARSFGETEQEFKLQGVDDEANGFELYYRKVLAQNGTISLDIERLADHYAVNRDRNIMENGTYDQLFAGPVQNHRLKISA